MGQDKDDWDEARRLLFQILDRNGFELATSGKQKEEKATISSISTGSGTVTYETIRQAMNGKALHHEFDRRRRNQSRCCLGQPRGRPAKNLEACYCPDRGDEHEGGKRTAGKLVLCRTLECHGQFRFLASSSSPSLRIGPWKRRGGKVRGHGWRRTSSTYLGSMSKASTWEEIAIDNTLTGETTVAGFWLNPKTKQCVQVATTHNEWLRDRQNVASIGLPESAYEEVMRFSPSQEDEIRLVAIRLGLVRIREHPVLYVYSVFRRTRPREDRFAGAFHRRRSKN